MSGFKSVGDDDDGSQSSDDEIESAPKIPNWKTKVVDGVTIIKNKHMLLNPNTRKGHHALAQIPKVKPSDKQPQLTCDVCAKTKGSAYCIGCTLSFEDFYADDSAQTDLYCSIVCEDGITKVNSIIIKICLC